MGTISGIYLYSLFVEKYLQLLSYSIFDAFNEQERIHMTAVS